MPSDESDATLVRFAKNGDRRAYAVLFQRHETMLRALCRRTLADSTLADDVVQDAAIQAMLSLDRLRDANRFGPWLCGIGLNLCRRLLRDRARPLAADWSIEVLSGGLRVEEPTAPESDPQDLTLEAELAARVRRAVDDLPGGQRASVLLFYLSGLTYAETAALLGIEVSAVKTRLHKARIALRRQLEDVWKERKMPVTTEMNQSVPVRVGDVRRKPATGDEPAQLIVILEEIDGERRLPIWVGQNEGTQTALQLEKLQFPRPPTIAFAANLLKAVGGRLREVVITKLDAAEVFYAIAVVDYGRKRANVDARPSDAINLALSVEAPISVEPAVFEAVTKTSPPAEACFDPFAEGVHGAKEIVAEVQASWKGPGALARQPSRD
jgi:RNA polymerase sigma factor (sigma-70 family)